VLPDEARSSGQEDGHGSPMPTVDRFPRVMCSSATASG
jgi:hypothetical protein